MAATRSGSVPYSSSPMSASPESFRSRRRKAGAPLGGPFTAMEGSVTDLEAREAAYHHVFSSLAGQRRSQLLDSPAAVLLGVDVLLAQQHDLLQPSLELALDDPFAHVLRPVGRLLGGNPLFSLALGRGNVLVADGQRRRLGRDVQSKVTHELDEAVGAGHEVSLAVDLHQDADLVAGMDVALDGALARLRSGPFGRSGLPAGAQDVHGTLEVSVRLGQRLPAGQDRRARSLAQGLDVLGGYRAHVV